MENRRLKITIFAILLGILTPIFLSAFQQKMKDQFGFFFVNPDGTRGAEATGLLRCRDQDAIICAQEYNITTGEPTGNSSKIHTGPRD